MSFEQWYNSTWPTLVGVINAQGSEIMAIKSQLLYTQLAVSALVVLVCVIWFTRRFLKIERRRGPS